MSGHVERPEIEAYLAGALSPELLRAFEAHVDGCEQCAQLLTEEAAAEQAMYELAEELHPAEVRAAEAGWLEAVRAWWRTLPSQFRGLAMAPAPVLALALAWFVLAPPPGSSLPAYQLEWGVTSAELRAAGPQEAPLLPAGSHFELRLRPQSDHDAEPQLRLFVNDQPADARLQIQRSSTGAARIQGILPGLPAGETQGELRVLVGPPGARWHEQPLEGELEPENVEAGWQLLRAPFHAGTE